MKKHAAVLRPAVEALEVRQLLMAGLVDFSFGTDGVSFTPVASRLPAAVARQPDGKLLVAGNTSMYAAAGQPLSTGPITLSRYNADGSVDTSFGPFGQKTLAARSDILIRGSIPAADGGMLLYCVPTAESPNRSHVLLKVTPAGAPDTQFGAAGELELPALHFFGEDPHRVLRTDTQDRIYFGGFHTLTNSGDAMSIHRFTPSGKVDLSFGNQGVIDLAPEPDHTEQFSGYVIDRADRIVVSSFRRTDIGSNRSETWIHRFSPAGLPDAGFGSRKPAIEGEFHLEAALSDNRLLFSRREGNTSIELLRVTPAGKLDTTYGGDGSVLVPAERENDDPDKPLLVAPDGRVVYIWSRQLPVYVDDPFGIAVIRSNGTLDPHFGGDGTQFHDLPMSYPHSAVLLQPDGKVLIAGASFDPSDFALVRYGLDGKFDKSFDADGIVLPGPGNNLLGEFLAVAALPDGRTVAVGRTGRAGHNDALIARYTTDGQLDRTFAGTGWAKFSAGGNEIATQVSVQADGKYLIAGKGFMARFTSSGALDSSFGAGGIVKRPVERMLLLPTGKILIVDGSAAPRRLNANGSVDSTFSPAAAPGHLSNVKLTMLESSPGGRYAVGGTADVDEAVEARGVLLRYRADGSLDTSFSGDGVAFPKPFDFHLIAVRPDGAINIVRNEQSYYRYDYSDFGDYSYFATMYQVSASGRREQAFTYTDPQGVEQRADAVHIDLGTAREDGFAPRASLGVRQMRVAPDGNILLSAKSPLPIGYTEYYYDNPEPDPAVDSVALLRFTPQGKRDDTFSANGVASPGLSPRAGWPYAAPPADGLAFDLAPGGEIHTAGSITMGNTVPFVSRFAAPDDSILSLTDGGSLVIQGTDAAETIAVTQTGNTITAVAGADSLVVDASRIQRILATLAGGNDRIDVTGVSVPVTIDGGAGDDRILVNTAGKGAYSYQVSFEPAASITGGDGNDLLTGGDGRDVLRGGPGHDTLRGAAGQDALFGGDGNDLLEGGAHGDSLLGEAGDDQLHGQAGNDSLSGDPGADVLFGGRDADHMDGRNGNTLYGGAGGDQMFAYAPRVTLYGEAGSDALSTRIDDTDLPLDLHFFGGEGDDVIRPAELAGDQRVSGGPGIDLANFEWFGSVSVSLDDLPNDGRDGDRMNVGSDVENVYGSRGNDRLIGSAADNLLVGMGGNDAIHGLEGNDTLVGDGIQYADHDARRDSLFGGDGDDLLISHEDSYPDRLSGGAGVDRAMSNRRDILGEIETVLSELPAGIVPN